MPHEVIMPALGMAQETGVIVAWLKEPGDPVAAGDGLFEVETDKATVEVPADASGFLAAVFAKAGSDVPVGETIALISSEKTDAPLVRPEKSTVPDKIESGKDELPSATASAAHEVSHQIAGRILASPKARRLARERGLDLSRLAAAGFPQPYRAADIDRLAELTLVGKKGAGFIASPAVRSHAGRKGVNLDTVARSTGRMVIAKEDVDGYAAGMADPAVHWRVDHAAFGPVREEALNRVARVGAATLSAANALIPQVTHHDRADMRAVERLRDRMRDEAAERGVKLTALAFHVKVLARCLAEFTRFNASLSPSGETLILKEYVHVGIATDTPQGLFVPVIRDADKKDLMQIAGEVADLAGRARTRKIRPDEMGGASMTISSLGGIGGIAFTPIINPPEVAILGISRIEAVPVWNGENWEPVPMVPFDLSYDHRIIDGATAARFLNRYCLYIADPREIAG